MTNFDPEPEVLNLIETTVEKTVSLAKIGSNIAEAADEDYNEDKAKELSTFNIRVWISMQG